MQDQTNVVASTTPAGGGDISPAPAGPATSQLVCSTAGAAGVVEQPAADDSPPAGSDESFQDALFDFELSEPEAEETTRFGIDTAGILTIATPFDGGIELSALQVRELYNFLMNTITVWRPACKRS